MAIGYDGQELQPGSRCGIPHNHKSRNKAPVRASGFIVEAPSEAARRDAGRVPSNKRHCLDTGGGSGGDAGEHTAGQGGALKAANRLLIVGVAGAVIAWALALFA